MARAVTGGNRHRATARLQKALLLECDPVPCPSCGSYQADMIAVLKRQHRRGLAVTGALLAVAGLLACAVAFGLGLPAWPVFAALSPAGLGLIYLGSRLARRFDPNAPAGSAARKAVGQQASSFACPRNSRGIDFIAAPDGTVSDVRYLDVHCAWPGH
jgi:hypothetical protein